MNALKGRSHYIVYTLLIVGIVWAMCRQGNGRYELAIGNGGIAILDTKTSRLWLRLEGKSVDLGTNQNPTDGAIHEDKVVN